MTDDEFISWLHRQGKPETKALEWWKYSKPADYRVKLGGKKEVEVERISDKEKADTLLIEWHRWSKLWRPKLGAPRISPYSRQSVSSKQYDDPADLAHDKVYQKEMEAVEYCVDALPVTLQQSIGTEMKNREVNAKVWRNPANRSYEDALQAILPVMRKRGLFD